MFPIMLDGAGLRFVLVGTGPLALKRYQQLVDAEAQPTVFAPGGDADLVGVAGESVVDRLPSGEELAAAHVVFVAGLDPVDAKAIAQSARDVSTLVNVEDVVPLCDFHTPSMVRRGDLLFAISTAGKSPTLAQRFRKYLEWRLDPQWGQWLDRIADQRQRWRGEGADMKTVAARTNALIDAEGWLPRREEG